MWGGTEPIGEVWYTGTFGECDSEYAVEVLAELIETDKAKSADIVANPTNYAVVMNGIALQYWQEESNADMAMFIDNVAEQNFAVSVGYIDQSLDVRAAAKCPTDITNVEVTVAKK